MNVERLKMRIYFLSNLCSGSTFAYIYNMSQNKRFLQPLYFAIVLAIGLVAGMFLRPGFNSNSSYKSDNKLNEILSIIREVYVDSVDVNQLESESINQLLSGLDPHSVYIPAEDLQKANEPLEGNFEGIGVEFNILNDTIMVVSAISGGPSEQLGIQAGDRIVRVDTTKVAGVGITSERVVKLLRGPKGTEVKVKMFRPSNRQFMDYTIERNTIPIHSVDAALMLDKETGYIKVSRFAATTTDEFKEALEELNGLKMQHLILDLRGNPGGYMSAAIELADQLLSDKKLVVYTYGRTKPIQEYYTEKKGIFEEGKLIVLIDEGSASASEILSGAVQDWDRGLVLGRRSFGKGLVQEPFELSDGSALRLTVSRYYTPSGRCIQKKYTKGNTEDYENEILKRYENGEFEDSSKISVKDSTIFKTKRFGRIVFGGGGIYPDVFVKMDTNFSSIYLSRVISNGLLNKFAYDYTDRNRTKINSYIDDKDFDQHFNASNDLLNEFILFANKNGIEKPSAFDLNRSGSYLLIHIKGLIARQVWHDKGYFRVINHRDEMVQQALKSIETYEELFQKK